MKLDIQSRSGRSLLPDGIIVADGVGVGRQFSLRGAPTPQ